MLTEFKPIMPEDSAGRTCCRMWEEQIRRLLCDEAGQDIVEYALVAVVIGLGTVAVLQGVTGKVINVFAAVGNTLTGNV